MLDPRTRLVRLRRELWHARNVGELRYAAELEQEITRLDPGSTETRVPSAKNPDMERNSSAGGSTNSLGSAAASGTKRRGVNRGSLRHRRSGADH